jgi:hypothetical protein
MTQTATTTITAAWVSLAVIGPSRLERSRARSLRPGIAVHDHEEPPEQEHHRPADREHVPGELEEGDLLPRDVLKEADRDGTAGRAE